MKIIFLFLFSLIISSSSFSQDVSSLEFKPLSHSIGIYQLEKLSGKSGLSVSVQATFETNGHLLGISGASGYGILNNNEVLKNTIHSFYEFNVLYGREFQLIEDVSIAVFSGLGYLKQTKLKNDTLGGNLNIPLRAMLKYLASNRITLGVLPQISFNNKNTITMYHFVIQFGF